MAPCHWTDSLSKRMPHLCIQIRELPNYRSTSRLALRNDPCCTYTGNAWYNRIYIRKDFITYPNCFPPTDIAPSNVMNPAVCRQLWKWLPPSWRKRRTRSLWPRPSMPSSFSGCPNGRKPIQYPTQIQMQRAWEIHDRLTPCALTNNRIQDVLALT